MGQSCFCGQPWNLPSPLRTTTPPQTFADYWGHQTTFSACQTSSKAYPLSMGNSRIFPQPVRGPPHSSSLFQTTELLETHSSPSPAGNLYPSTQTSLGDPQHHHTMGSLENMKETRILGDVVAKSKANREKKNSLFFTMYHTSKNSPHRLVPHLFGKFAIGITCAPPPQFLLKCKLAWYTPLPI